MMPRMRYAVLAGMLGLCVAGARELRAQGNLALEIRSTKPSYLLAEPVLVDITVRNAGSEPVAVKPELAVETQNVSLDIAQGTGTFERYDPGFVQEPSRMPQTLQPAEAITHRQLVLYSRQDFAFPSAGSYRLRAMLHGFGVRPDVASNTIEIQIAPPAGGEAEAMRLFRTREVAELALELNEAPAAVDRLELLMTRHRDTVYGKYAQYYLARRQMHEFFARKANPVQAGKLYRDLLRRDPQFPLAARAHFELGTALSDTDQKEEARQAFDLVVKTAPDTLLRQTAARRLQALR